MAFSPARDFEQASAQYASITNASGPNLNLGGANTIFYACGWIRIESFPNQQLLIGKQASNLDLGYQWDLRIAASGDQRLRFVKAYGTTDYASLFESTVGALSSGVDYFFEVYNNGTHMGIGITPKSAGTRNASNETADTNAFRASSGQFWMGTRAAVAGTPDSSTYFDGAMSGVIFILGMPTTGERNAFYNGGNGVLNSNKPSLSTATYVSFWNGDEASGANLTDSVSGYTLTQVNTVGTAAGMVVLPPDSSGAIVSNMSLMGVG